MKNIPLNERIIFALDFADPQTALTRVEQLDDQIKFFKVGLQLFLTGGFPVIEAIIKRGNKVMVDLKFFDIPETVHLAVQQLTDRGITFATIHGNEPMIKAALRDRKDLKILAVTVLTSFGENDLRQMGITGSIDELVLMRAGQALALGGDGVVASPREAATLRAELGDNFVIVTPGIRSEEGGITEEAPRPAVTPKDDQVRIATAKQAIINGSDHLVIGRPIREADNPKKLIESMHYEIEQGLKIKNKNP